MDAAQLLQINRIDYRAVPVLSFRDCNLTAFVLRDKSGSLFALLKRSVGEQYVRLAISPRHHFYDLGASSVDEEGTVRLIAEAGSHNLVYMLVPFRSDGRLRTDLTFCVRPDDGTQSEAHHDIGYMLEVIQRKMDQMSTSR